MQAAIIVFPLRLLERKSYFIRKFVSIRQTLIRFLIGKDISVIANMSIPTPLIIDYDKNINGTLIIGNFLAPYIQTVRTKWESEC